MTAKVVNCVVCDEVRREDNGKEILIGVYGGAGILVPAFPVNIILCFWYQFEPEKIGAFTFSARVLGPDDVQLVALEGAGEVPKKELAPVALPKLPIQVQKTGDLKLQVKFGGSDEWQTIKTIEIRTPQAGESIPPSNVQVSPHAFQ